MESEIFLKKENAKSFKKKCEIVIQNLINWKLDSQKVKKGDVNYKELEGIPNNFTKLNEVIEEFVDKIEFSTNFSSFKFLGFPDAGNSQAGIIAGIIEVFLQQNLINSSFCAPYATKIEIETIRWMREILGYELRDYDNISDIGGAVTNGGVLSNTYALMAAYRKYFDKKKSIIILPENIGHYSLTYAPKWLNFKYKIVYCKIKNYRYDEKELRKILEKYGDKIFFIGAYAGDSRTMTVDHLENIYNIVKSKGLDLWLHCDACHGFSLSFSKKYKDKIKGIEKFDSITLDPHKVLWLPYTMSMVLFKNISDFKLIVEENELITSEKFSIGKTTPFIGSKSFSSLKLWMLIKHLGVKKIGELIEERISNAKYFAYLIDNSLKLKRLNEVEINSVVFIYYNKNLTEKELSEINRKIYLKMLNEGVYYFHSFKLDVLLNDKYINLDVLRFMSGNNLLTKQVMEDAIKYIEKLGDDIYEEFR